MMKILGCVKQVPDTTEIKIDSVKNPLIRDDVPSIVNPFEVYTLETAEIIVSGGRGAGGPEVFDTIKALADMLGATVGTSRAAVGAG